MMDGLFQPKQKVTFFNWVASSVKSLFKDSLAKASLDASITGKWGRVKDLIQNGCNVDSIGTWANSALHNAVLSDRTDVVVLLLEHGANPDVLSQQALDVSFIIQTPLHIAVSDKRLSIIKLLLFYGARCDIKDSSRKTVLQAAAHDVLPVLQRYLEIVDQLKSCFGQAIMTRKDKDTGQSLLSIQKYIEAGTIIYEHFYVTEANVEAKQCYREKISLCYDKAIELYRGIPVNEKTAELEERVRQMGEFVRECRRGKLEMAQTLESGGLVEKQKMS